jgi:uncharacterized membrane protein YdbT with pleckstrin-like domain
MKFIRKKNLQENEEILYTPILHWFYTIKYMVLSLPVFVILLIVWIYAEDYAASGWFPGITTAEEFQFALKYVFLSAILAVLLVFVCRIFIYICVEFGVTNKRLIIKKGVLRVVVAETPIDRVESICCVKNIFGRMFNYGDVRISGIGGKLLVFRMVYRPYDFRRKIIDIIEKNKAITVIHGEFSKLKPPVKPKTDEEEPAYRYGTFVRVIGG